MIFEILISLLLLVASVFGLVGSYGLLKLKDPMARLHAPTKATTVGVGAVLIASMLHAILVEGRISFHEVLISLFLFLTAPITAHFIAKAHMHRRLTSEDLPRPTQDACWATYDRPAPGDEAGAADEAGAPRASGAG